MNVPVLPVGFTAAGMNAGIKNERHDLGVIVAEVPSVYAACLTTNRARAHCVNRAAEILAMRSPVRAVVVNSGSANAMSGPEGRRADERMAEAIAVGLDVPAEQVITASTGSIGSVLPVEKIEAAVPALLTRLGDDPTDFSAAIMTTDRVRKVAARDVFIAGTQVRLHALTKGAGMIQPSMATMLCFVTTDADIDRDTLQGALEEATARSFNQITVDEDMSTNDMVVVLASGGAENERIVGPGPARDAFAAALGELLEEMAIAIARDGEGATRLLDVRVEGARSDAEARKLALGVCGGSLVKSAIFGADPYAWGRIAAALGARASIVGAGFDPHTLELSVQNVVVYEGGRPVALGEQSQVLKQKMKDATVNVVARLGLGEGSGRAWGCDLSYEYVRINADYGAVTAVKSSEPLGKMDPSTKKGLLIEALRYIYQFRGRRAVIKLGGAAMIDPALERQFAEDVLLLESVGLKPIVVHGGGPEISQTLDRLGHKTEFVGGLRVTDDASMDVVEMVLSGRVNQRLVAAINRASDKGVGLSGKDGSLIRATKMLTERDLGRVGEVTAINTAVIEMLIGSGRIPVVSPIGLGEDGNSYNINADVVAASLASALKAEKLIYLSDVAGYLEGDKVVADMDADQLKARIDRGEVKGGMLPKLQASLRALREGVERVHLVDGRVPHNLIAELFTDSGVGTLIRRAWKEQP